MEKARDDSLFASGVLSSGEGRYREALVCFHAIRDTLRPAVYRNIAAAYLALGEVREGERALRRALRLDTGSVRSRLQLADLLDRQGRIVEAEPEYRRILGLDSNQVAALAGLGRILAGKRDYSAAIQTLGRAIRLAPKNGELYESLGGALAAADRADSARSILATCLALNPSNGPAKFLLASLYMENRQFVDAFRLYSSAARSQPWNSDIWLKAGLCKEKLGELDDAAALFRRAAVADSTNAGAYAHLGSVQFRMKQYDSSVIAYGAAARLDPENPGVLINLGISCSFLDSTSLAIAALRRAIVVMKPEDIAAVYMRIGALQIGANLYAGAKTSYLRSLRLAPGKSGPLFYLGFCCDQLQQFKAAVQWYSAFLRVADPGRDRERIAVATKRLELLEKR